MIKPGDCFRIESGVYSDGSPKLHIFVVVTDFDQETGDAILVSFSSITGKPHIDTTTIVHAGAHEFITEESYVAYYLSKRMSEKMLLYLVKDRKAFQGNPINIELLTLIREGIKASKETPLHIKDFYDDILYRSL